MLKGWIILKALERVYTIISQQFSDERITTAQAANAVGLTRGVTSSYLSKLEKQGKLLKTGSRPVYWQVKCEETAFDKLIGYHGSLKKDIKHAIEAIIYPTNGLPILISGSRGTGKLLFAHTIYREAIRRKIFSENSLFKIIDCAEYKNKINTLLQNKKTFNEYFSVSKKNINGYLYVKNLQVLNHETQRYLLNYAINQEKLNTRFIFSTTNQSVDTEYENFKYAIVKINLNPFNKRPFAERIAFSCLFLQNQANKLNRQFLTSFHFIIKLANLTINSITELSNHIQLLCAEKYANAPQDKQLILSKLANQNTIRIMPNQQSLQKEVAALITKALQLSPAINDLLNKVIESLTNGETIVEQNFLVLKVLNQIKIGTDESLLNSLIQTIQLSVKKNITHRYGITFQKETEFWRYVALAFILANMCNDNSVTIKTKSSIQFETKSRYPRSYYLYKQFINKIYPKYVKDPYYYIPFFVLMAQHVEKIESVHYNAILLAHGESTASSIQQVINTLCGNYIFEAFNMPIDISADKISSYVQKYLVDQGPSTKGNIILFDMGSLRQIFREIKKVSDQKLLVVNNITTAMALDIGLRIQQNEMFESIAENSQKYGSTTDAQYYEGLSNKKNIIVSCISGVGLSKEIKKLIETTLSPSLEVITFDYKHLYVLLKNNNRQFFSKTQLILTTTNIDDDMGINIINVYNIFDKQVSLKLQRILLHAGESLQSSNSLIEKMLKFLSIEGIRDRLKILNPDIVIQESQTIVSHYEDFYNVRFEPKLKLNLYMHLSLMVERMLTSSTSSTTSLKDMSLSSREKEFISLSKGILQPVEQKFNIKIQDYEIELLYQLLKDFIFA